MLFGQGRYQPSTGSGRKLLVHELAHVAQQNMGGRPAVQRKLAGDHGVKLDTKGFTVSRSGDTYTCPSVVKGSLWNEIFTALLFSPRMFKLLGSSAAEANKSLEKHMVARYDVVSFASKKRYSFGARGRS